MKYLSLSLWCFATALAWVNPAGAQSLTADQILQQFNAVIFENFSASSDVEGRAVIGGLLMATLSTLFFVPVVYSLLRRKSLAVVVAEELR